MSLVRRKYGSWSIAQGIKAGMSDFVPKMCGNELEKDGAAWIAAKCIFPMQSLHTRWNEQSNMSAEEDSRIGESKGSFRRIVSDLARYLGDVLVECSSHVCVIAEDEGFLNVETNGNDVFGVGPGELFCLFDLELGLEQELLVILGAS